MAGVWKTRLPFPLLNGNSAVMLHVSFEKNDNDVYEQITPGWDTPGFSNGKRNLIAKQFQFFDGIYYGNLTFNN